MTKEEALKVIRHMAYLSAHVIENGVEAYEYIEQLLSKPSLPSNLDEAAEEYANTHYGEFVEVEYEFGSPIETIVDDKPFVRDAFKVGAQWRDAQILKSPNNIDEAAEENSKNYYCSCLENHNETGICDGCENVKLAFKAGAEWMAGHGVTVKGLLYGGSLGIPDIPEEFYTDKEEEVIVQIRKK